MKHFLFFIFLGFFSLQANAWDQMCGFADQIHPYIKTNSNSETVESIMLPGQQGETSRIIRVLKSGDWVVTFEFFSSGPVETDVSCIIASGKTGDANAYELTTRHIKSLPSIKYKDFGKNQKDLLPLNVFHF